MFCGTYQTYCSALPSSNPAWLKQPSSGFTTAGPSGKKPSALPRRDRMRGRVEQVLPILRPVLKVSCRFRIAQGRGELGDREVVDRPLQRDRRGRKRAVA